MREYGEDALIEQPAIRLFEQLGWETANCFYERVGEDESTLGRRTTQEVVLVSRLRATLQKLNPKVPDDAIDQAIEQLILDRGALHPVVANREVYRLIRNGVKVTVTGDKGGQETETVRVIDWDLPENNDFFLASQFWVSGEIYKRRIDLLGFVNGLPLVLGELKASHRRLETAYQQNLRDYKSSIPQLFCYNAFVILSNGSQTKIGSTSARWEHFNEWKKVGSEEEPGVVSLDTVIRGTCEKDRLLDLVENFTLFTDIFGGLAKILAKNHQFLGVTNVIKAVLSLRENQGRLGVFWHTQGSGKSYSMIFFSQKVLRKIPGNWTFVVVTDRTDLDDQIYKNFAAASAVTEPEAAVRASSGEHLKQLLREDHRYVFTMIHKFHTERGGIYPKLSERSDVIVLTDEAHRTQYDILARNMRDALPSAAFLAFTGTPLMLGEEKTRQVFGDYVSIYDFRQSVADGATVPLYYENRIPELQLTNVALNEDIAKLLEEAELDENQEKKLEREFSREYHLITREGRLEEVVEDIVSHFMARGQRDKAMVVAIDKATAVRMYNKVRKYWGIHLDNLREELQGASDEASRLDLSDKIKYMEETDMAVVVSQSQNEVEDMKKKGLDILPHRKRILAEDLDSKFKDPDDRFRIVFVCAMWMTGFDVPACSTIYLDKPMRNHTLMQTIARANRVFGDKVNGLIVDYVGVFRDLQKALAIYGSGYGGRLGPGEMPVQDKSKLVEALRESVKQIVEFCRDHGVSLLEIQKANGFGRLKLLDDALEALVVNDSTKRQYLSLAADVLRLHKAILPDALATEFTPARAAVAVIAGKIRLLTPDPDITGVVEQVDELLDRSIAAEPYVIRTSFEEEQRRLVDLSKIDFEAIRKKFEQGRKHTEAERLRAMVERRLRQLVRLNKTRIDFQERFQRLIDEYNAGAANVEEFFRQLVEFANVLNAEEKRSISESLSEEQLALFDILSKPEMELTNAERNRVKRAAQELLDTLTREKLVLDWRKRQQSRAEVRVTIESILDGGMPEKYTPEIFNRKCDLVYQHIFDSYFGEGRSIYAAASSGA
jgi:type I restriction enzyme R subunit